MTDLTWTNITVKLGDLKPWADNPRTSSKAQAKRILASFEKFGQVTPIAVGPNFEVYDGHQRLSALLTIHGANFEVEARQSSKVLTDDERRALVLALANATGSWSWDALSGWNADTLKEWGFDKDTLGGWKSDVTALGEFLKSEEPPTQDAEPQTDRAAELLEKWGVKSGDLWQIGEHRLICGDCTDAAVVARVMDGEQIELVVTDPPYGVDYSGASVETKKIEGDDRDISFFLWFIDYVDKDVPMYIFCDFRSYPSLFNFSKEKGRPVADVIVWDKTDGTERTIVPRLALMRWIRSHEFIAYFGKMMENFGYSPNILHCRKIYAKDTKESQDEFISQSESKLSEIHPTIKPLQVIEKLIGAHDLKITVDFYAGSGTTLVACQNLGRRCRAVEISPAYVAVALERMAVAFPELEIKRLD